MTAVARDLSVARQLGLEEQTVTERDLLWRRRWRRGLGGYWSEPVQQPGIDLRAGWRARVRVLRRDARGTNIAVRTGCDGCDDDPPLHMRFRSISRSMS